MYLIYYKYRSWKITFELTQQFCYSADLNINFVDLWFVVEVFHVINSIVNCKFPSKEHEMTHWNKETESKMKRHLHNFRNSSYICIFKFQNKNFIVESKIYVSISTKYFQDILSSAIQICFYTILEKLSLSCEKILLYINKMTNYIKTLTESIKISV